MSTPTAEHEIVGERQPEPPEDCVETAPRTRVQREWDQYAPFAKVINVPRRSSKRAPDVRIGDEVPEPPEDCEESESFWTRACDTYESWRTYLVPAAALAATVAGVLLLATLDGRLQSEYGENRQIDRPLEASIGGARSQLVAHQLAATGSESSRTDGKPIAESLRKMIESRPTNVICERILESDFDDPSELTTGRFLRSLDRNVGRLSKIDIRAAKPVYRSATNVLLEVPYQMRYDRPGEHHLARLRFVLEGSVWKLENIDFLGGLARKDGARS